MKIRIVKENTQPFEGKTKYFLEENVAEVDIDELNKLLSVFFNPTDTVIIMKIISQFLREEFNIE